MRAPLDTPTGPRALDALLKGRDLSSLENVVVASYDPSRLNILRKAGKRELLPLETVLSGPEARAWKNAERHLLLPPAEREKIVEEGNIPKPYWDRTLEQNPAEYAAFIRQLHVIGLVKFERRIHGEVGCFFVCKKNGDLRLVLDCRSINSHFRIPPRTLLVSGSQIGEIWTPDGSVAYCAGGDVEDAFYNLFLGDLCPYFGLNALSASSCGATHVGGEEVKEGEMVFPVLTALPMGFSWSLHLCQNAVQSVMRRALPELEQIVDGRPAPTLDAKTAAWLAYVDNLVVFGTDPAQVERHHAMVLEEFNKAGLCLHEIFGPQLDQSLPGYGLVGGREVKNDGKRVFRFINAVRHILSSKKMSGRLMEVVLGHYVSLSLLRRGLLSVPSLCYAFVHTAGNRWMPIPGGVRRELRHMLLLLPLAPSELNSCYDLTLSASDASGADGNYGFGVCTTVMSSQEEAHSIARFNERWRFQERNAEELLEEALTAPLEALPPEVRLELEGTGRSPGVTSDNVCEPESAGSPMPSSQSFPEINTCYDGVIDHQLHQSQKRVQYQWRNSRTSRMRERNLKRPAPLPVETFPGLPSSVVEEKVWQVRQWGCFRHPDHIGRLEARACLLAVKEKLRNPACHGLRAVHFCDNLSFVLAFGKGRCKDFGSLSIMRKFSALLLGTNTVLRMRWLEGARNPADAPSRRKARLLRQRIPLP